MNKSHKLGFIGLPIVTGMVTVAIVIIGGFFLIRQGQIKKDSKLLPTTSSTSSPTPAITWKTYTNNFLKFSIDYPKEWISSQRDLDTIFASTSDGLNKDESRKDQLRIFLTRTSLLDGQSLDDYVNTLRFKNENVISREVKMLAGNQGIQIYYFPDNNPPMRLIYVRKNSAVYTLSATPADSELMPTFDQMLQSFKFLP